MHTTIFTDGSCLNNPGPGGYAFLVTEDGHIVHEYSNYVPDTTNNRMEMQALIAALKWAKENGKNEILAFSDSRLLVNTLMLGWKRKANIDLWLEMEKYLSTMKVKVQWVKAHANNNFNNRVDELANNAAHGKCVN